MMALCRTCSKVIPCYCHVAPPVEIRPGVYLAESRHAKSTRTDAAEQPQKRQDGAQLTPDLCPHCEHNWHGTGRCDGGSISTITGCRCTGRPS